MLDKQTKCVVCSKKDGNQWYLAVSQHPAPSYMIFNSRSKDKYAFPMFLV